VLGVPTLNVSKALIDQIYREGKVHSEAFSSTQLDNLMEGGYVVLRSDSSSSAVGVYLDDFVEVVHSKDLSYQNIKPRDVHQVCAFHSFKNFDLTILQGSAGTGKTTLALSYAVDCLYKKGKSIVLCKPTSLVGGSSNAIAAIPGNHREKIEGYIDSYLGCFTRILGQDSEHYVYEWEELKRLRFLPLELTRGLQFDDSIVILDEAQNTTPHELLTLISRVADSSQIIVMGDPLQIDIDKKFSETGLGTLIESDTFWDSDCCSGVALVSQYRSGLALFAGEVLKELHDKD
jgi:predicted ribonuclease YlaK